MRIHTDTITPYDVSKALRLEKEAGRIDAGVYLETNSQHGSHSRAWGVEIKLAATGKTPGRRFTNHGAYGAGDAYAATYDEWGWLLAALFAMDPKAFAGSANYPVYQDAEHFHERTGWSYNPLALIREVSKYSYEHGYGDHDPYPFINARVPEQVGRIGYGRTDAEYGVPSGTYQAAIDEPGKRRGQWLHYMPRMAEGVARFAHLDLSNLPDSLYPALKNA